MSSIGLGGLGRQTDRPKLIEDYSKPEIRHTRLSTSFEILRHSRSFDIRHTRLSTSFDILVFRLFAILVFLSFVGTMTHGSVSHEK